LFYAIDKNTGARLWGNKTKHEETRQKKGGRGTLRLLADCTRLEQRTNTYVREKLLRRVKQLKILKQSEKDGTGA
jgi:hypothetical protein